MPRDSQRGYLSGVLQRAAQTTAAIGAPGAGQGLNAPLTAVQPAIPTTTEVAGEIEVFEPALPTSQLPRSGDDKPIVQHPSLLQQPVTLDPLLTPPTPSVPASMPRSETSAQIETAPQPDLVKTTPPNQPTTERSADWIWGDRLPRLVKTEGATFMGEPSAMDRPTPAPRNEELVTFNYSLPKESSPVSDHRVPYIEVPSRQSEPLQTTPLEVITETPTLTPQSVNDTQLPLPNSEEPAPASAAIPTAPPETIEGARETIREIVVERIHEGPQQESLVMRPVSHTNAEDARSTTGRANAVRNEPPRLTINRIDVQIVGQTPAPVVQVVQQAPPPQPDTWETLERYHLGHVGLIF